MCAMEHNDINILMLIHATAQSSNFQCVDIKGQTTSLNNLNSQLMQFHVMVWGVMSVKNAGKVTNNLNC